MKALSAAPKPGVPAAADISRLEAELATLKSDKSRLLGVLDQTTESDATVVTPEPL